MSKSVATESNDGHESGEKGEKRGARDEGSEDGEEILDLPPAESLNILTVVSTVPATTDQFMHTPEYRRHFVEYVPGDTLMTLRLATKGWKAAADAFIDEGVESGTMIVHDGKDISYKKMLALARSERRKLVTRVVFPLNITKVGGYACRFAVNLVVVDIPEGVERIGILAFSDCRSLTTVSFPTALKSIGVWSFYGCTSLENVHLLHTNLQEIGACAFYECSELTSMMIPDSLQTLGDDVFHGCSKLVPSNTDVTDYDNNTTSDVVAYLRSKQQS
ncbi:hypothetical protein TL16_g01542 [Triparma laevis f. inornata]|uniref:Uncharacterized protein n=2 Tax=Triparma laevis TaxID=1534972 RepID=A0A9W7A9Y7_9STRA|nr:hypothetical protein TL16_g01542 [Triparma laevis f. inornata]GMH68736.1 hypothetical protein TrLO_g1806 [Triparma laevis f. longispina]